MKRFASHRSEMVVRLFREAAGFIDLVPIQGHPNPAQQRGGLEEWRSGWQVGRAAPFQTELLRRNEKCQILCSMDLQPGDARAVDGEFQEWVIPGVDGAVADDGAQIRPTRHPVREEGLFVGDADERQVAARAQLRVALTRQPRPARDG